MKMIRSFRDSDLVRFLSEEIHRESETPVRLMEVCGGHTHAIQKYGLKEFLPGSITLLSGPGCPVCVSSIRFIDHAIILGKQPDVILVTYGDLLRVPGSRSSLEKERNKGCDIRVVYSVLEAVSIAEKNPQKEVIFLAIGFETTAPASAAAVLMANSHKCGNFSILSAHKVMPPALETLAEGDSMIDGFIAPGHVSAITGVEIYRGLVEKYCRAVVISGFEPVDILQSVLMLVRQLKEKKYVVENQYARVVRPDGNPQAKEIMNRVFECSDAEWRGLGVIPLSGLTLREEFSVFDAGRRFHVTFAGAGYPESCICGEILAGRKSPDDCSLFAIRCNPVNPVGACMVSAEGACAIHYKFRV
jgi:hydrogenase expression/formation protein HypD